MAKARGVTGQAKKNGFCLAQKKGGGGKCQLPAGFGTDHTGYGKCKWHGGSTPTHIKAAAKNEARILLGHPIDMNPLDALLWCIRLRAGEVKWLSERMAELQEKDWTVETMIGKQFHLFARERSAAMNDLARYSQMAISLGIAERAVKLAETYGILLGKLLKGVLDDLQLTPDQRERAPLIVRRHLIAIDSGGEIIDEETQRKALPQVASG